ncbi:isocitrate lyase/PEP mutase family protein [Rhizobiales bacterium]|uniref:isocitrate lyase/PEP mutase family protein n=1 Tax=Hongsoonwoonella zoysiae TaxID=2821844 RepID=UPI0015607BF1|nr:isocitrate lyase/PEP mutase family protein [Hongsoonwoonella zoysiae]NRG19868.1 isocitrate lyase/PEP mutase family protein [Hongsoonwoonella zoysiae]
MQSPAERLRAHLEKPGLTVMPCCYDGLSAKMIGDAGFPVTFMSGFAVSAARLGMPDTGLISYGEIVDQGRNVCAATSALIIGDGDTGYGNALNVRRTVQGYARAGFAAIMIEDQVAPKRCGHTKGKLVVDRIQAVDRIKAAVDAREEGEDILILARTDARHGHGLDEALERARAFKEAGADILFVEAPKSRGEMETICREVPGWHMANLVEGGETPILPSAELQEIGYRLAAFPLTILSAAMKAMRDALEAMKAGRHPEEMLLDFAELRRRVGFDAYYEEEQRYADRRD